METLDIGGVNLRLMGDTSSPAITTGMPDWKTISAASGRAYR